MDNEFKVDHLTFDIVWITYICISFGSWSTCYVSSDRSSSVYSGLIMPSTHPLLQMFQILKCSKDTTRAIFFKGIGFKDIKCDIPLCHDSWMSCHEGHEYKTQHLLYFMSGLRNTLHANEAKRTIVLRTPFLLLGWRWKQWAEILWVGRSVSRDSLTNKGKAITQENYFFFH